MRIDFKKYKIKYPSDTRPNNKHYKKMLKRIKRDMPKIHG